MKSNRRQFLKVSAAAAASVIPLPLLGASGGKRYRTALIGCGWWGANIVREAMASKRCQIVGLCDVYHRPLQATADEVEGLTGDQPRLFDDYRDMLKKLRPEIVIVATPDHWHALPSIAALEAGAHLFVEKPTSHTIVESQAMLRAAEAGDRVTQVGLHRRIGPHHRSGMDFIRSGKAGDIGMIRLFVTGEANGIEQPAPNSRAPSGMNWDMWCGPAPWRPYNRKLTPGGWRNFLDYANGTLGDWGVHWLDQVLWWTDEKYPKSVYSTGGRHVLGSAVATEKEATTDAPDSQVAVYEFESFTATWEHKKYSGNHAEKHRLGAYFYGTKGVFHMGWRDGWTFYPKDTKQPTVHEDPNFSDPVDGNNLRQLWGDFLDAIDSGRQPAANLEIAHRSSVLPMLGMLSYRLGRSVAWDGDREQILNDPEAAGLMRRDYRKPWMYPAA
ncbi:MAG: Inositol 2-dehydrogenase [Verrucomicrobia subdivision 3 bacterium]|nr:Inositol 2-dehydrogenase [Limisphaerales bacterium]MCS1417784.1 Inositol 2-dehydrogenase [Limisphaerales bacterium]